MQLVSQRMRRQLAHASLWDASIGQTAVLLLRAAQLALQLGLCALLDPAEGNS
jgi:hypothetical protein